jgi:hypothetical protein
VLLKIHVFRNVRQGRWVNSCYRFGVLQCPVRTINQSEKRRFLVVLDPKDIGATILRNAENYLPQRWLWNSSTNRKVAGSIPDGIIGIFHWLNPSGRTMVDTASNRNVYQEYLLGGKGGRCVRLTILPPCLEILEVSTSWSPRGLPKTVMGFNKPKAFHLQYIL